MERAGEGVGGNTRGRGCFAARRDGGFAVGFSIIGGWKKESGGVGTVGYWKWGEEGRRRGRSLSDGKGKAGETASKGIHQVKDKAPGKQADGVALPHCNILKYFALIRKKSLFFPAKKEQKKR